MKYHEKDQVITVDQNPTFLECRQMKSLDIRGVSVGSDVSDISFLKDLLQVDYFGAHFSHFDPAPLYDLVHLKSMRLYDVKSKPIEFHRFPNLQTLEVSYKKSTSLFHESETIKDICIFKLPGAQARKLAEMKQLERLTLFGCSAQNLSPIGQLMNLDNLRIVHSRQLEDNQFIESLANLDGVLIQECSGFGILEPFRNLIKIRNIVIEKGGEFESIEPVKDLLGLEVLALQSRKWDYVKDDEPRYVLDLPKSRILFCLRNRWNYSRIDGKWVNYCRPKRKL